MAWLQARPSSHLAPLIPSSRSVQPLLSVLALAPALAARCPAFLWCNLMAGAAATEHQALLVNATATVVDQTPMAPQHLAVPLVNNGLFTPAAEHWGRSVFVPLAELLRGDRRYLEGDRLLLRVEFSARWAGAGRVAEQPAAGLGAFLGTLR